jgi:hypothetical protein
MALGFAQRKREGPQKAQNRTQKAQKIGPNAKVIVPLVFCSRPVGQSLNRQYFHRLAEETGTDNYLCTMDGQDHTYFRKVMKPALSREALAPINLRKCRGSISVRNCPAQSRTSKVVDY